MLRTGWVVVRRDRGVAVAEFDGQGGIGDHDGDGLPGVSAPEGGFLSATMITPVAQPGHLGRVSGLGRVRSRVRASGS